MKTAPMSFSKGQSALIGSLFFGGLALIGWGFLPNIAPSLAPSGLVLEGKSLSVSEADLALKEIGEMAKNAKAGDPSSINFEVQPKTQFGRKFRDYMVGAKAIQAEYDAAQAKCPLDKMLEGNRLQTSRGRKQSLDEIDAFEKASRHHTEVTDRLARELWDLVSGMGKKRLDGSIMESMIASNDKLLTKEIELCESYRRIIELVDKANPSISGGKLILSDQDFDKFHQLTKKLESATSDYVSFEETEVASRQKRMSESLAVVLGHP